MRQVWLAVLGTALLGGCATVIEKPSQEIAINTTPSGATCTLTREGAVIGTISPTPGSVRIHKNGSDIEVACELDGYEKAGYLNESATAAAVFGNVLIGGLVGIVVDLSTGASNKYESEIDIALAPRPEPPPPVVAAADLPPPRPVAIGPAALPSAVTVDLRRAGNAVERYRVLSKLAADGLVPQDRYDAWAKRNVGAFLLHTAPPASVAAGNKPPNYEQLAEFMRGVGAEKNRAVAEAERQALFGTLLPMEGARAQPMKPPADGEGIRTWFALLDQLRDEGLVGAELIGAEKTAINDARIVAGLSPVPVYSAIAGATVE